MKIKRITRSLIVGLAATCMLFPGVTLAHAEGTAPEADAPAAATAEGLLDWNIRASFNNYTLGATFIQEGATRKADDSSFTFPLQSYNYNAKTEHTEAQFGGLVRYRKYCGKGEQTDLSSHCQLDLIFKNPKVVLDPAGSYLEATVSSKQYPGGDVFKPAKPVKIATLATAGGTFAKADGRIKWSNIPTQLTEDGLKMFSNFYKVGDGLDPLSFEAKGEGERLSTDNIHLATKPGTWYSHTEDINYDRHHSLYQSGKNILVAVGVDGLYLLDSNLNTQARKALPLSRNGVGDFDAKNSQYYYTTSASYAERLSNEVKRISVGADNFGEEESLGTVPGKVYAIGFHKKTGVGVVISVENPAPAADSKAYLTKIVDGKLQTPVELPSSEELWGSAVTGDSLYALSYFPEPSTANLLSMNDGTFVYLSNSEPLVEGHDTAYRKFGISIDPSQTEPSEIAKLMNKSTDVTTNFMEAAATNGTDIVRWNHIDTFPHNEIEYLKYNNREMVSQGGVKVPKDLLGIAGAAWDKNGELVLLDGVKGRIVWVDPATMEPLTDKETGKVREYFIPNGRGTWRKNQGNFLALENGSYYLPTYNEGMGDWIEHYELVGLYDPTVKDEVKPVITNDGEATVELEKDSDVLVDDDLLEDISATDVDAEGAKSELPSKAINIRAITFLPAGAEAGTDAAVVQTVDPSKLGTYTVTYFATDPAGNVSDYVTRTYTVVVPDTVAPVITVAQGKESISFTQEERVLTTEDLLADVSATDKKAEDGESTPLKVAVKSIAYANDSSEGTVVESVDLSKVGTYTVTFAATDDAGNSATAVSRTFVVAPAPVKEKVVKLAEAPKATVQVTKDVPANTKFSGEISWMIDNKFSTGWDDGTYRPLNSVNRDAMAAFLYRMAGSPKVKVSGNEFKDTSNNAFKTAIAWMKQTKISTGWDDGTYRPLEPVSREAMAAFLHRFCTAVPEKCATDLNPKTFDISKALKFKDVTANNPFSKDIAWLSSAKITTGWEDGTFRPHEPIHRDAMAAFLYRLHHNKLVEATK